jgi:hypothetical protein
MQGSHIHWYRQTKHSPYTVRPIWSSESNTSTCTLWAWSWLAWGWLTGLACHSTEIKQAQEAGRRPAKQTMRHVMFVSLPFHSLAIPVDRNGEQNSKGIPSQRLSAAARQPDRIKQTKKKKRVVQT